MPQETYKYFAFISYSSKDSAWGERLQRKLEHYRMSTTLCREHGWSSKTPARPIFFAPTDIQPGPLKPELQERLRSAQHLIVICSPNSARSHWVGEEISYFHSLGRADRIHFFIIDGTPHSDNPATECFHPVIRELGLPEILGANINEPIYRWARLNRERAYVQLITKLLNIEFDTIWQRHKRLMMIHGAMWAIGALCVLAALVFVWVTNQPVDVELAVRPVEERTTLPPMRDAVVALTLDDETKIDTVATAEECARFLHIPHRYLDRQVGISLRCRDFQPIDTQILLNRRMELPLHRDPAVYGHVHFRLWDQKAEKAVANCRISVGGIEGRTDDEGYLTLEIPLEQQDSIYHLSADRPLDTDVLIMPCGEHSVVCVQ